MEANRRRLRVPPCQGPETREGTRGPILVEEANGGGRQRLRILRRQRGGRSELPLRRQRPSEPLERNTVEELLAPASDARPAAKEGELRGRREPVESRRRAEPGDEHGQSGHRVFGVEEVPGPNGVQRIWRDVLCLSPRRSRVSGVASPEQAQSERELSGAALRSLPSDLGETLESLRPRREGRPDAGLDRVVAAEDPARLAVPLPAVEADRAPQRSGLGIGAYAEVEHERGRSGARPA